MMVSVVRIDQANKFMHVIPTYEGGNFEGKYCVKKPFNVESDFLVYSVNYDLSEVLSKEVAPNETL